jgi:hypothetical protein
VLIIVGKYISVIKKDFFFKKKKNKFEYLNEVEKDLRS